MEGNGCKNLIKEADKLQSSKIHDQVGIFKIMPIIAAFKTMDEVVDRCFTAGKVGPSLNIHMEDLLKVLNAVKHIDDVAETLKLRILTDHAEECMKFIRKWNEI